MLPHAVALLKRAERVLSIDSDMPPRAYVVATLAVLLKVAWRLGNSSAAQQVSAVFPLPKVSTVTRLVMFDRSSIELQWSVQRLGLAHVGGAGKE
jgi:hypothetical protein